MINTIPISITTAQIEQLQQQIKSHRDKWVHITRYPIYLEFGAYSTPMYYLGSPIYPCGNNRKLYEQQQQSTESVVLEITVDLQQKVLQAISEYFNLSVEHLSGASIPGFHIFNSLGKEKELIISEYHIDYDICHMYPDIVPDSILSFVFIVEVSAKGDRLDYIDGSFEYEIGKLYIWPGDMLHKIGDVCLSSDDDYRITYQGHCIKTDDKLLYYW